MGLVVNLLQKPTVILTLLLVVVTAGGALSFVKYQKAQTEIKKLKENASVVTQSKSTSPSNVADSLKPTVGIGTESAQKAQTFKVAIYNGTNDENKLKAVEDQLKKRVTNLEIVSRGTANKIDYLKTIVVDVVGNKKVAASQLAGVVKAEVASLPKDEDKPNADFLIIVGK